MTLDPILTANPVIQIHVAAALFAIVLGPAALYLRHGSVLHRVVGYSWVIAMALLALSSFGIHGVALIGPFSPLHGLAVLTLWSLWEGIRRARAGQIARHRRVFRNLYWFGVMVAGLFNFLPGRAINRVFLSESPEFGYAVIVFGLALAGAILLRQRPARPRLHDRADHAL
jgi:uncharacterized membrane protein